MVPGHWNSSEAFGGIIEAPVAVSSGQTGADNSDSKHLHLDFPSKPLESRFHPRYQSPLGCSGSCWHDHCESWCFSFLVSPLADELIITGLR